MIEHPSTEHQALKDLITAVNGVCKPLFTAGDGGAMWLSMRHRPDSTECLHRLKKALAHASELVKQHDRATVS